MNSRPLRLRHGKSKPSVLHADGGNCQPCAVASPLKEHFAPPPLVFSSQIVAIGWVRQRAANSRVAHDRSASINYNYCCINWIAITIN